jgi:hypothetical protein
VRKKGGNAFWRWDGVEKGELFVLELELEEEMRDKII